MMKSRVTCIRTYLLTGLFFERVYSICSMHLSSSAVTSWATSVFGMG